MHFLAAAAIKEKGALPDKDEAELEREAEKASRAPGVQKMTYAGQGGYDVRIEQDLKPDQQLNTLQLFLHQHIVDFQAYWSTISNPVALGA